ncbi:adenylate/guanylate cyclase domain-containing protein [Alcanivorax sp. 24]|uniref:adenylate/guanylate cyclase domain-containing protein n=1 Tax=Alcanivorax sp. 24 TaxID=2545266 RepID=UPI00105D19B7|nr:adenylate/guanylate cyclase domain-containing protein [Alcanivorax sp. 24]
MADPALSSRQFLDLKEQTRRQTHLTRILAFLVASGMLGAGIGLRVYPFSLLWAVAPLLAYPLLIQLLAMVAEKRGVAAATLSQTLLQADALCIGFACACLWFAVVPSLALLAIVHANAMSHGGWRPWLGSVVMTALGAGVGGALFYLLDPAFEPVPQAPLSLIILALLGLAVYMGASAFFAQRQTRYLRLAQQQVREQQRQALNMSRKLAKYLPPQIWGSLFTGKRDAKLETRRKRLTVFFSDIKGFSAISEELPLDTLTAMLNTYLSEMTRIALRHGGTIDKFIGDAVMVFFGDPKSEGAQEDAFRCVAMAIEMQRHMRLLRQRWKHEGIKQPLEIRIGINTGYVTVGNFGTDSRMDYTILGTDVNLASRLESACRPGQVLISESTHELVRERIQCRSVGDISAKGFSRPIPVYEARDLKRHAGSRSRYVSAETGGFALHMDLERIHNFDKKRILGTLARSATDLKDNKPVSLDFEAEGFVLHLDSGRLHHRERPRVLEFMGRAARRVQEQLRL